MMRKNGTFRSILTAAVVLGLSLFLASCGGGAAIVEVLRVQAVPSASLFLLQASRRTAAVP